MKKAPQNKETFEERIVKEFNERFSYASFTWNGDTKTGKRFAHDTKREIKSFFLQALSAQKSEMTAWCWKEIEKALIEQKEEIEKTKSDGKELEKALSAQKKEWREKIGKYKFPEIKHEGELLSIEFPKAKNAHESNELFLQFGWNQALQEVLEILE
mgnify:FL=1